MISKQNKNYELIPTIASLENYNYMRHPKRRELSCKITELMEDKKKLYRQLMFLMVGIDRVIDYDVKPPEFPLQIRELMKKSWTGKLVRPKEEYKKIANEFVLSLRKLRKEGFRQAEYIYSDFLAHLYGEYKDVKRKGEVLSRKKYLKVRKDVMEPCFSAWFQTISFELKRRETKELARRYTLPIIEADTLTDIKEDLESGIINIPKEDIIYLDRECGRLDKKYYLGKIEEAKEMFREGDRFLKAAIRKLSEKDKKKLTLFRKMLYSWIEEAEGVLRTRD